MGTSFYSFIPEEKLNYNYFHQQVKSTKQKREDYDRMLA